MDRSPDWETYKLGILGPLLGELESSGVQLDEVTSNILNDWKALKSSDIKLEFKPIEFELTEQTRNNMKEWIENMNKLAKTQQLCNDINNLMTEWFVPLYNNNEPVIIDTLLVDNINATIKALEELKDLALTCKQERAEDNGDGTESYKETFEVAHNDEDGLLNSMMCNFFNNNDKVLTMVQPQECGMNELCFDVDIEEGSYDEISAQVNEVYVMYCKLFNKSCVINGVDMLSTDIDHEKLHHFQLSYRAIEKDDAAAIIKHVTDYFTNNQSLIAGYENVTNPEYPSAIKFNVATYFCSTEEYIKKGILDSWVQTGLKSCTCSGCTCTQKDNTKHTEKKDAPSLTLSYVVDNNTDKEELKQRLYDYMDTDNNVDAYSDKSRTSPEEISLDIEVELIDKKHMDAVDQALSKIYNAFMDEKTDCKYRTVITFDLELKDANAEKADALLTDIRHNINTHGLYYLTANNNDPDADYLSIVVYSPGDTDMLVADIKKSLPDDVCITSVAFDMYRDAAIKITTVFTKPKGRGKAQSFITHLKQVYHSEEINMTRTEVHLTTVSGFAKMGQLLKAMNNDAAIFDVALLYIKEV